MPDLSNELKNILRDPKADLWKKCLNSVLISELTQKAATMIDFERIALSDDWESLDSARYRERLIPSNNDTWQKCISVLLQEKKQINQELKAKGFNGQSTSQLHSRLVVVLPALLSSSSRLAAQEPPFPLLWSELGNYLAAKIFSGCRATPEFSEPIVHQKLLFVSFLWSCRFPEAKYLRQFLNNSENLPNGLRGKLFRIPATISADGILDKPLPLSSHPKITSLKFESESDLVFETVEEARKTFMNDGFCHRVIMERVTELEFDDLGMNQKTREARSKLLQMYEHTMLAYMALSCVEQMLRMWAESMNVIHLKPNGHPIGVHEWIDQLSPTPGLRATIDEFYNPKCSNIRNRLMHGNLLEIENKSLEMFLHIAQPSRKGGPDVANDAFTAQNIANLCLNCLIAIDAEIPAICFGNESFRSWTDQFNLSKADIEFGLALDADCNKTDQGLRNLETVLLYSDPFFPALRQFIPIGFIGWLRGRLPRSLVMICAFGFVFENLFRSVVQTLGYKILQISYPPGQMHMQYQMLDSRPNGICTDDIIRRIVDSVPVDTRDNAERVLRLAIDSRNALAHGALHDLSEDYYEAMGKIFFKAIQATVGCCLHAMIKDAAYFHWLNNRQGQHGTDREDWQIGWIQIAEQLRKLAT